MDLPPNLRKEGATFDRFGVCNATKSGGAVRMYFGDLEYDGQAQNTPKTPPGLGWAIASALRILNWSGPMITVTARRQASLAVRREKSGHAWRGLPFSFYADRVGPLNLEQRLEASGKVKLVTAGPDSDIFLGWFNSAAKTKGAGDAESFVGIHVGGPTRVGHYFIPVLATAKGEKRVVKAGPVLKTRKGLRLVTGL